MKQDLLDLQENSFLKRQRNKDASISEMASFVGLLVEFLHILAQTLPTKVRLEDVFFLNFSVETLQVRAITGTGESKLARDWIGVCASALSCSCSAFAVLWNEVHVMKFHNEVPVPSDAPAGAKARSQTFSTGTAMHCTAPGQFAR